MERKTIRLFKEYQGNIIEAFEHLKLRDQDEYTRLLSDAEKVIQRARRSLPTGEFGLFSTCAERALQILRKCHSLGLSNLKKRLLEYRVLNTLEFLLEQHDNLRLQKLQGQNKTTQAA